MLLINVVKYKIQSKTQVKKKIPKNNTSVK